MNRDEIRKEIARLVNAYFSEGSASPKVPVRYGGSCHGAEECIEMINAVLDGWWEGGKRTELFENSFTSFLGAKASLFCNSGSSANILATRLMDVPSGSEFITPAVNFPTTINQAVQNGLMPVLVDVQEGTYNIDADKIEEAITPKTKAMIIPHILGNVSDMEKIARIAEDYNLFLMEDCCDALGSKFKGRHVGTFGKVSTFSFYPSHHITCGGGGMLCINDESLLLTAKSLRNWGRAFDKPEDFILIEGNELRKDFILQYTYKTRGYNFLATEVQAAMGLVQLKKIRKFEEIRSRNFQWLMKFFKSYDDIFVLPRSVKGSEPVWFCFPMTIREGVKFTREQLMSYLYEKGVESRYILAGNIARQPAYKDVKFRIPKALSEADRVFTNGFFVGLYQGLDEEKLQYMADCFTSFLEERA